MMAEMSATIPDTTMTANDTHPNHDGGFAIAMSRYAKRPINSIEPTEPVNPLRMSRLLANGQAQPG